MTKMTPEEVRKFSASLRGGEKAMKEQKMKEQERDAISPFCSPLSDTWQSKAAICESFGTALKELATVAPEDLAVECRAAALILFRLARAMLNEVES